MDAYVPSSTIVLVAVLLAAGLSLTVGFLLQRTRLRIAAWLLLLVTIAGTHEALAAEPAGFRMLVLVGLSLYAMKALVGVESHRVGHDALPLGRWLLFAIAWLGMKPQEFSRRGSAGVRWRDVVVSVAWIIAGAGTIVVARWMFAELGVDYLRTTGFVMLAGCSMVLHFGVIGLLAATLGALGLGTTPQFRAPWRSQSLQEFWARRWNVGFSVMTTMTVYRPAVRHVGRTGAIALGFVASGLLHELGCSMPVHGGYGLPMLYFALHAVAVGVEHILQRRGRRLRGITGRIWVYGWVLLPAPLLFHDPFLRGIVLPLL